MYESFYNLKEKPFNLTPDPDYVYMSPGHENAFTHLEYAIMESKGFVVITGEIGSGKTTLINYLLRKIPQNVHIGIINNTFIDPQELLKMICQEFEIPVEGDDKTVLLTSLYGYLLDQFARKERVVLILDEAQNLSEKTLEEIRMLSNLESEKHHLIQMILVGQPQLKEKLQRKSLEQFVQRVTVYCHLDALDKVEVNNYIYHRLQVAGAENLNIFDENAIKSVYKHSLGIPRLINILCDAALVYGYADDLKVIGWETIETVAQARKIERGQKAEEATAGAGEESIAALPLAVSNASVQMEKRLSQMELKMAEIDQSILRLREGFETLNGGKDEKDRMILNLLKMLKKSMESRAKLMMQIVKLNEQLTSDKAQPNKKKSANAKPSLFPISKPK